MNAQRIARKADSLIRAGFYNQHCSSVSHWDENKLYFAILAHEHAMLALAYEAVLSQPPQGWAFAD